MKGPTVQAADPFVPVQETTMNRTTSAASRLGLNVPAIAYLCGVAVSVAALTLGRIAGVA